MIRYGSFLLLSLLSAAASLADESHVGYHPTLFRSPENNDAALILDWNSRYVIEGRDSLSGQGIWSATAHIEKDGFLFGGWLGSSEGADYEELNLFAEYSFELYGIGWYVSYNHLQFLTDDADDNELGAGFEGPGLLFGIVPGLDWYYSVDADGSFAEFSLAREFEMSESLTVEPAVLFGRNDGYIPDGHHGANHIALQFGAAWEVNESVTISAYIARNFAIDRDAITFDGDESLMDFSYGGVAVSILAW